MITSVCFLQISRTIQPIDFTFSRFVAEDTQKCSNESGLDMCHVQYQYILNKRHSMRQLGGVASALVLQKPL